MGEFFLKIHPVGHGLFCSSRIQMGEMMVNLVYDIGSRQKSLIKREVEVFVQDLPKKRLDLLILSHLDKDHVNGLQYIKQYVEEDSLTIEEVWLPYLFPLERIILIAEIESTESDNADFYVSFIIDPIRFLKENLKVKQIHLFESGNFGKDNDLLQLLDTEEKGEGSICIPEGIVWPELEELKLQDKVEVYSSGNKTVDRGKNRERWKFKFCNCFTRDYPRKKIQDFQKCIQKVFGAQSPLKILELIAKEYKEKRRDIIKCHRQTFDKSLVVNNSSLILFYHLEQSRKATITITGPDPSKKKYELETNLGLLLTGDINLRIKNIQERIFSVFNLSEEKVFFVQIPHHGSKRNWNNNFREKISEDVFLGISSSVNDTKYWPEEFKKTNDNLYKIHEDSPPLKIQASF